MNTPLKHSDALDAYADLLVTYSDRRVRLATTLAVCAVLGVCVALLALATYWTLEQHAAATSGAAASRPSSARAWPLYGCEPYGITGPSTHVGGVAPICNETWRFSAVSTPAALRYAPVDAEPHSGVHHAAVTVRQSPVEPLYD